MNIDELTLGQIKQIQSLCGFKKNPENHPDMGKKVIIRTYSAGVHYGTLESKNGNECRLKNAIRLWYWEGAFTLSQLAMMGTNKASNCKFAVPVDFITLEWIEIIPCSETAIASIEGVKVCEK